MVLRLVLSAGVLCGVAAADQPLQALKTATPLSMQACTQLALQNAVNPARQKKLMQDSLMGGRINYAYVLDGDKTIAEAKTDDHSACAIPLTQERLSTGTRFELRKLPSNFSLDSMAHSGLPVCGVTATAK